MRGLSQGLFATLAIGLVCLCGVPGADADTPSVASCSSLLRDTLVKGAADYQAGVEQGPLKNVWGEAVEGETVRSYFEAVVQKDGHLQSVLLLKSSGDPEQDNEAEGKLLAIGALPHFSRLMPYAEIPLLLAYPPHAHDAQKEMFLPEAQRQMTALTHQAKRHWRAARAESSYQVVVQSVMDVATGRPLYNFIVKSACAPQIDQAALASIEKGAPYNFKKLLAADKRIDKNILTMQFIFSYDVPVKTPPAIKSNFQRTWHIPIL